MNQIKQTWLESNKDGIYSFLGLIDFYGADCMAKISRDGELHLVDLALAIDSSVALTQAKCRSDAELTPLQIINKLVLWYYDCRHQGLKPMLCSSRREDKPYSDDEIKELPFTLMDISKDPVAATLRSLSFIDALRGAQRLNAWWLREQELSQLGQRLRAWKEQNQDYIESKAKEFADFWSGQAIDATPADRTRINHTIYKYALNEFQDGFKPFFSTSRKNTSYRECYDDLIRTLASDGLSFCFSENVDLSLCFADMPPIL